MVLIGTNTFEIRTNQWLNFQLFLFQNGGNSMDFFYWVVSTSFQLGSFLINLGLFGPFLSYFQECLKGLIQWFSNCVPRHFGVPSEIQRVLQIFFVNMKHSSLSIEI
jgi:hypothetical protein